MRGIAAKRGVVLFAVSALLAIGGIPALATDTPQVLVSKQPDRSVPVLLADSTLSGDVYIFVEPATPTTRVRFWLDDPGRTGSPQQVERTAPWDFAGTAEDDSALVFDTRKVGDGGHVVTAVVDAADGTTQTVHATFAVANSTPAPSVTPMSFDETVDIGAPAVERSMQVSTGATSSAVTLTPDQPWISVTPASGSTPLDAVVRMDPAGLPEGSHTGLIVVSADGFSQVSVFVTLRVGGAHDIEVSTFSTRSPSAPLAGSTVDGDIYVFVSEQPGLDTVRFWIDNPGETGTPFRTESNAPYDLAGGTVNTASPFRSTQLPDGPHSVTARMEYTDGTKRSVTAEFVVANDGPALVIEPSHVTTLVPKERPVVDFSAAVSATSGSPQVQLVSDVDWLRTTPCCTSVPASFTVSADPTELPDGRHTGTITATSPGYGSATFTIALTVAGDPPTQLHLAYVADPRTSLSVAWRTSTPVDSMVEVRELGETEWQVVSGVARPFTGSGVLHEVTVTGLTPATSYEYRVPGDGAAKSPVHSFRTAPDDSTAFDVVYFADTGIVGRSDGLTTGTADVIADIAAMKPLLVLPGGDYAYYDTDNKRFATLDEAIDAWFRQVEPFAAGAAMMPTYGNHEVLLKEGFAPWAARFPTPSGHDDRRNYSFDVGPVHFISILAVHNQAGIESSALKWLKQDLAAAVAAGRPWIVPYMHVSAFAGGTNHPANLALREQLGPVFEQYGVDLVLMSHDQAYVRTWPLVDVATTIQATSTRLDCVSKDDGVTWLTISPSGKLSNKNGGYSPWAVDPAPAWTAVRSNTEHHVARLHVGSDGDLRLQVLGYPGNGGPAFAVDNVRFSAGDC